jgi:hypothetical protein
MRENIMLDLNIDDPEKLNMAYPDIQRLSKYWYIADDNTVVKAHDLLEAVRKGQQGYYILGDHSGNDCEPTGNIWNIGYGIVETILHTSVLHFNNAEQLVRDFYCVLSFCYWMTYPTNRQTYDKWLFYNKYSVNCPYTFLSYKINDNVAEIDTALCNKCNSCSLNCAL